MVNFARIEVSRNFALNKRAANHRPCPHRASAHTSLLLIQLQREKGWNFNYFFAGIDNLRIWFCVKIGRTASWISVWVTLQYARASSVADPRAALPQWHNVRIIHGEKMVTTQLRLPPSPFYNSPAKKETQSRLTVDSNARDRNLSSKWLDWLDKWNLAKSIEWFCYDWTVLIFLRETGNSYKGFHWDQRDCSKPQLNRKRSLQSKGERLRKKSLCINYVQSRPWWLFCPRIASLGGNKWTSICLDLQAQSYDDG